MGSTEQRLGERVKKLHVLEICMGKEGKEEEEEGEGKVWCGLQNR